MSRPLLSWGGGGRAPSLWAGHARRTYVPSIPIARRSGRPQLDSQPTDKIDVLPEFGAARDPASAKAPGNDDFFAAVAREECIVASVECGCISACPKRCDHHPVIAGAGTRGCRALAGAVRRARFGAGNRRFRVILFSGRESSAKPSSTGRLVFKRCARSTPVHLGGRQRFAKSFILLAAVPERL